jgi:hypothetical protein
MHCRRRITITAILLAACVRSPAQQLAADTFVENQGQFDPAVKYKMSTLTGSMSLTANGVVFEGGKHVVFSEAFIGSNPNVAMEADPAHVGSVAQVDYKDAWPDISVRVVANSVGLEQQFLIQPGGNANDIAVRYEGVNSLTIDREGSLVITTALGTFRAGVPNVYQEVNGYRISASGRYRLIGPETYGFDVNAYSHEYPLVISPTVLYSSQFAGASTETPAITYFNVAPTSAMPGQAVIGTLLMSGVTSANVNGLEANCSNGQCGGTFVFNPSSTTNYVLQAAGPGGSMSASQNVEVGKHLPNPTPLPAGLEVTWQGACWLKNYPKSVCNGACQGMAFSVNTPTPLPLEATLYLNTEKCNPASQDNLNDYGTPTGSGGWVFWFLHHPNHKNTSAIWTIGNQSSGCVNYAKAPACP